MPLEIEDLEWEIKYGNNRAKKVTLQIGDKTTQSLRPGDKFTLDLQIPYPVQAGDHVSINISVIEID